MRKLVFLLSSLCVLGSLSAQTLMTIDGQEISKGEFEYYYHKNNQGIENPVPLEEYVDLFVNFQLKVAEAYKLHYDTARSYQQEWNQYREQLVTPYLTDSVKKEELVQEAYSFLQEELNLSHILFRIDNPEDEPAALKKAQNALQRLQKEDFETVAYEVSEDHSVQYNKGNLGWITGLMLVYPFEKAAYDLQVGEISEPVKTQFGYHIIKMNDRRPSRGEVRVAHILKRKPEGADSIQLNDIQIEVNAIYDILLNGADFAGIAQEFSEDGSAAKGGELPWLSLGMTNEWFQEAAFALGENDSLSKPIETPYGWHIIQLLDRRPLRSLEDYRPQLESRINMDSRRTILRRSYLEKLKKEYNFQMGEGKIFATFANQTLTQKEFEAYKQAHPTYKDPMESFIYESVVDYEKDQLEIKHPSFGYLMNEYRDGILLFNICNDKIWSKAAQDEEGLTKFFEKNKENYKWDTPHYKGWVIYCTNDSIKTAAQNLAGSLPTDSVGLVLKRTFNKDQKIQVKVKRGLFTQGKNDAVDAAVFGDATAYQNPSYPAIFTIGKILGTYPSSYRDVRGPVISDYQTELENKWVEKLRKKHRVKINQEVLSTVK